LVAATGGLLFGFDTAVISGTVGFFTAEFGLDAVAQGWVASSALIGCILGALIAGSLSDKVGRKKVLLSSAVFFAVSAVWCWVAGSSYQLVFARLIGGVGVGAASLLSPLYIAEVAPPGIRGVLVGFQQLAIVFGILVAYFSNFLVLGTGLDDALKWRWMFGLETVPAVLFFILLLTVPESPRWLIKRKRSDEAFGILARINPKEEARKEVVEIETAIAEEEGSLLEMLRPGLRTALFVGILLAVFQQVTGINAILYYAPEIFKQAGADATSAFGATVWIGLVNIFFTVISMILVDWVGRRPLLLIGAASMGTTLVLIASGFHFGVSNGWLLAFVLGYVGSFSLSMGVTVWVVISEIFPTRTRGRAMSVATVALWASCFLVSQTFPIMAESLGPAVAFLSYALMCLLAIFFIWRWVPETKGRSLEEIERSWRAS